MSNSKQVNVWLTEEQIAELDRRRGTFSRGAYLRELLVRQADIARVHPEAEQGARTAPPSPRGVPVSETWRR